MRLYNRARGKTFSHHHLVGAEHCPSSNPATADEGPIGLAVAANAAHAHGPDDQD